MTEPTGPSIGQVKQNMRAMWMEGDFGVVARMIAGDGDKFIGGLALPAGSRVLDVACGTGNLAIPAARAGCEVTGVDIAANLLDQARERAAGEGLKIKFDEGDAEQLPYEDASFDAVVTMFGAMFAPRPDLVAAEFARVLKPGGLLAMANWTPQGFTGQMFRVGSKHVPPPPGIPAPVLWGDEATVRGRLSEGFKDIQMEKVPIAFDFPTDAAGVVDFFRTYFGPSKVQFGQLDAAGQAALAKDLTELYAKANQASDPASHTVIENEFLKVTARRS